MSFIYIYENELDLPTRGYGRGFGFNESHHIYFYRNYVHDTRAPSQVSARDVFIYNNVFANTRNCCSTADQAGCSEGYPGCSDEDKRYQGVGQALAVSGYSSTPQNVNIVNNLIVNAAEAGLKVGTTEPPVDGLRVINNVITDTSNANSPSFDPPGSEATWSDYSFASNTPGLTNFTFTHNVLYSALRSKDIRFGSNAYTVAEWNAFGTSNVTTDANVASNPGLSGYVPASASSPLVNTGTVLSSGPADPSSSRPLNSTYAHALHPSSTWPSGVVIARQGDYGSGWERGPFVYVTGQANSATLSSPQTAEEGEAPAASTSAALSDPDANEELGHEKLAGCNVTSLGSLTRGSPLWVLGLAGFALLRRLRRAVFLRLPNGP